MFQCKVLVVAVVLSCSFTWAGEDAVEAAEKVYQSSIEKAQAEFEGKSKAARELFSTKLKQEMERRTRAGDLDGASIVKQKLATMNGEQVADIAEKKPDATGPKPGLLMTEYPRLKSQDGEGGAFIPKEKLGEPVGESNVIDSLADWRFNAERNAVVTGFLKITTAGEYAFRSDNFYDRNALYVNNIVVCKYRDGENNIVRIKLPAGFIPISSVGYVEARGTVRVRWIPPGQKEQSEIPSELLFHIEPKIKPVAK